MATTTTDAIILGAGHNGLILQAYLAKEGLQTVCLERAAKPGGGLTTVEFGDAGFLHNTHSFYHRGITALPWYRDLQLARHGARYLTPELNVAMLTPDEPAPALEWWTDFDKTLTSFANYSQRDADTLLRWRDAFRPIVQDLLGPEAEAPPLPPQQRREKLEQSSEGRLLLETSVLSPMEFVRREFEHPAVQAGLLFFNGLREVDLRQPGFGHHIPALLASGRYAQMCVGGSAKLGDALVGAVTESGGEIHCGVEIERIVARSGRATAVDLAGGDRVVARKLVASSLNPQQTFLDMMATDDVPAQWRKKAQAFKYNLLAPLFGLHVNLTEAPDYSAGAGTAHLNGALMTIHGLKNAGQFEQIVAAHESGRIPGPRVMWGSVPSRFDVSQAPEGRHTAFMWEKLPYHLAGDPVSWQAAQHGHGQRMLKAWAGDAPNLARDGVVLDSFTQTPLEVERALPNMRHGDLLIGAFANDQVGYHRPFPGAGHYRTHLDGLYLCGSCCHPGGNITGLPAYNAAQVIRADLGIG